MNLYSVEEISKKNDKSEQHIRTLLREGSLPGKKVGSTWVAFQNTLPKNEFKNSLVSDRKFTDNKKSEIVALSFFSGAMGLDIGIEKAGISVRLASEIDKRCRQTILANNPDIGLIGNISEYSVGDIREYAGLTDNQEIDVILGGPPCQAFSTAGNRHGFNDERGNVFLTFIERIIGLNPKFAVIENVRGLLSAPMLHRPHSERGTAFSPLSLDEQKGGALRYILSLLKEAGYGVSFNLYNSANFGSPQKRERVVMICSRDGKIVPFLEPTHSEKGEFGLLKWNTFKSVVKDLKTANHEYIAFPEKRLVYYRLLKSGENWKNLPVEKQKKALGASYYAGGGKTGFLRRLDWDEPSPTLVTHPAMPATDLAHPKEDRPLSVQEYKRVQEFPDDWIVCGTLIDKYKQIGNAVPVSLGYAIGKHVVKLLNGEGIKEYPEFNYSRYKNTSHLDFI